MMVLKGYETRKGKKRIVIEAELQCMTLGGSLARSGKGVNRFCLLIHSEKQEILDLPMIVYTIGRTLSGKPISARHPRISCAQMSCD
jgi:hypothetical protein